MGLIVIRATPVRDEPGDLALLDDGERVRAGRRRAPAPFVTAHALLRCVAAGFTGADPATLRFTRRCTSCGSDRHGKPALAGHPGVHASVSYADDVALVAVGDLGPLGVDVEQVDATGFSGFADVTLADVERPGFEGLSGLEVARSRARVWARKEAVLKATGHGLVVDPTQVVVSGPREQPRLVHWRAQVSAPPVLVLRDLDLLGPTHEAALAILDETAYTLDAALA